MRIAYVINSVEGGGAAAPVPAIARVLQQNGAEVLILALTGRNRRGLPPMEAAGLDVRVRPDGESDHRAALQWLTEQASGWKADLVWTSLTRATLLGQIAGRRLGLPVVSWQHNAWLRPANRLLLRLRQRHSALWVADSECVAALTRQRLGIADERLVTWPLFAADEAVPPARRWRPGETVRIGSLGRLHPAKGYDVLIEALAILRTHRFRPAASFELLIAGDGAERERLAAAIDNAGLDTVRLVGFQPDPRAFLAGLHLYVQPSRREGLCIAVHEAMEAGLPVIGAAVGEMPWTIRPRETGLVVAPGDAEGLAFALAECLSMPEALAEMGAAARVRVLEKFGRHHFEAVGAAIMRRLAAATSAAGPRSAAA
ncbi:glycosyltransferase family 4 protein [Sphingomonas sp. XMGL2]|uniref:Glycosyltransferase family 4 protein n=2 Tax=Sphingomonas quercus TaxID=2842451 RepID=A0ABS6BJ13_9SPHN|nr:glycosyltransferase family 4 protein [Sphingomonas quercus]MBU3077602.1 glycosyltransferase family 4 protein [Sphingomonas quercus]